ncbi:TonB-dependent receptor, plug [Galbibacter marinus]|uniref:TonB-dependent receptor, plug n=1 Tax=Galbibacter marinus TaxID=555500 RepID=K2QNL9_9FLAO|nr:carboxypeptidase-like regulatory domain-containing protein [Galbibacter marinus]EKF56507.1 TonB-dependent receptor, plug [Galbibacter marinus]
MKNIFFILFTLATLSLWSQNITTTITQSTTLKELFSDIEAQIDYKFAYTDDLDIQGKFFNQVVRLNDVELTELINQLNNILPMQFSVIGDNITVHQARGKSQGYFVYSGRITDEFEEPLIGVSIHIKEANTGTTTDENGSFSLRLPSDTYTVNVTYIGYRKVERTLMLTQNINHHFQLEMDTQTLEEVVVTDQNRAVNIKKPQMSVNHLSMEQIKQIPVAMGESDPLKALMTLPGVTNAGEGSSGFNVRGGAADQNLILLDGAPIYSDSHLFGFFSVFNADAVNSLDLYKGGIPSKFGGRVSSVLDVQQQQGNYQDMEGTGGIGLISSRLSLKGPILKDKLSYMVAGRASYAHLFLKLADNDNSAMFYDINARLNYRIDQNNSIHFSGYSGSDMFDLSDNFTSTYGNMMGNLGWKHTFSNSLRSDLSVFYSDYRFELAINTENFQWESAIKSYGLKYDWVHRLSERFQLNYGINSTYYDFNPGTLEPQTEDSQFNYRQLDKKYALESAAYLDVEHKLSEKLNLRYGLRYSLYYRFGEQEINTYAQNNPVVYNPIYNIYEKGEPTGSISYGSGERLADFNNFEPRISLSYALNDEQSIKASYNRMAQYIHIVSNSQSPTPMDIWTPSGPFIKPQILDQYALGYFRNFNNKLYSLESEVFYKRVKNRIDYVDGADLLANNNIEQVILNGKARAYGLELLFRKNKGDFTGWAAYTLSRAEQKTVGRSEEEPGIANGNWYVSPFDKLHNLNIVGNYRLTDKWTFSGNFSLQSGQPVTYPNGYYEFGDIHIPNFSMRNENRLPIYHHLDLAATYTPKPNKTSGWRGYWVFSIYNIYSRKNAASIRFTTNEDTGINEARRLSIFGIVPSISYNFKF